MEPQDRERPDRLFLAVSQVAQMLSLDDGEIEGLLERGELRGIRIGTRDEWRIERSELDSYIEAKYEEARRSALFNGFDFGAVSDFDQRRRPTPPPSDDID